MSRAIRAERVSKVQNFFTAINPPRAAAPLRLVETVCPDSTLPRGDSLFPINQDLPPLIMHVKADVAYSTIVEFITKETMLPLSLVIELIEFGSVYFQNAGQTKLRRLVAENAGKVAKGSYARVHVNPRRYPDVSSISWKERIRVIGKYIVLDKPSGAMPHMPTVDNSVENVMSSVSKALNLQASSLYPVGRLDACTSGLCIFATDKDSARRANDAIQSRTVRKFYSVLCYEPSSPTSSSFPKAGVVQHLFRKKTLSHPNAKPTLLRSVTPPPEEDEADLWQLAQLSILDSSRPFLLNLNSEKTMVREVSVELGTGLTHQIRLQMAALGYPVINDSRYFPVLGLLDQGPNTPQRDGSAMFGREPRIKTGLHCAQLIYPGSVFAQHEDEVLTAQSPWWREKE